MVRVYEPLAMLHVSQTGFYSSAEAGKVSSDFPTPAAITKCNVFKIPVVYVKKIAMKAFKYLLLTFCFFAACRKSSTTSRTASFIEGSWSWFKSTSWVTTTPQSTGKSWELIFNPNLTCTQSGTLFPPRHGTYTLTTDSLYISFTGDSHITRFRHYYSQDTLKLDMGSEVDAPLNFFVRK